MTLRAGNPAPDFILPDQKGEMVRFSDFRGKKTVILYFYPKDDTPGCTAESCTFRDSYEDFQEAGAEVIGVSSDTEDSHKSFALKYRLPFKLLSDRGGEVRRLYGVPSTLGLLPGRVTFVIDKDGIIRHVFSSQFRPKKHIDEALKVLKNLKGRG